MSTLRGLLEQEATFMERVVSGERKAKLSYVCTASLVLAEGQEFEAKPRPAGVKYGQLGNCYENAALAAFFDDRFEYVEGYGLGGFMPVHHAFLLDRSDGKVFDVTWRWDGSPRSKRPHSPARNAEYMGIVVPKDVLRSIILDKGTYSALDWDQAYRQPWSETLALGYATA